MCISARTLWTRIRSLGAARGSQLALITVFILCGSCYTLDTRDVDYCMVGTHDMGHVATHTLIRGMHAVHGSRPRSISLYSCLYSFYGRVRKRANRLAYARTLLEHTRYPQCDAPCRRGSALLSGPVTARPARARCAYHGRRYGRDSVAARSATPVCRPVVVECIRIWIPAWGPTLVCGLRWPIVVRVWTRGVASRGRC